MPLKRGKSKSVIASNIKECINSYKKTKKIGNIKPRNLAHAVKICQAMAYKTARKG